MFKDEEQERWRRSPAPGNAPKMLGGNKEALGQGWDGSSSSTEPVGPQFLLGGEEQPLFPASLQPWKQLGVPKWGRDRASLGLGQWVAPWGGTGAELGVPGPGQPGLRQWVTLEQSWV